MSELIPLVGDSPFAPPPPATEEELLGQPMTTDYRPTMPSSAFWTADGLPRLNVVADIEAMLLHPQVEAALAYYKGAVHGAKFEVEASSPEVQECAEGELQKFWQTELETAQTSYDYGWGGFELCYKEEQGKICVDRLLPVHPRDCRILRDDEGGYCGVRVRGARGNVPTDLPGPRAGTLSKAFWFSHRPRYDRWYGRSQLRGAWRPWRRLAGRDGCEDTIDGGFYRGAYSGPAVGYPAGTFNAQNQAFPNQSNHDAARDLGNRWKNGGTVVYPNVYDDRGNKLWEITAPQMGLDVTKWLPYEEWLSKRISVGIGVPPEIQEAADTGSGYSGRLVPLEAFFAARDVDVRAMLRAWLWQVGVPLVRYLYGPDAWVRVKALPLLESRRPQAQGPGRPPGKAPAGAGRDPSTRPVARVSAPGAPQPPRPPRAPRIGKARLALEGRPVRLALGPAEPGDPLPEDLRERLADLAAAAAAELADVGPEAAEALLAHYRDVLAGLLAGAMTRAHQEGAADYLPEPPAAAAAEVARALRGLSDEGRELLLRVLDPGQAREVRAELQRPEAPAAALPHLDAGARKVRARRAVPRPEFDALADAARRQAFTVAGDLEEASIERVKEAVAKQAEGTISKAEFKKEVESAPFLSPAHLETVFRTNVMAALSDGLEAAVSLPGVAEGFPYRGYDATHDSRVRPDHLKLERAGLDGTNVYRADDPVWEKIRPPWDFNDRCTWRPLSIEQAAELGVKEAILWRDSGTPPERPAHVPMPDLKPTTYQRLSLFDAVKHPRDEDTGRFVPVGSESTDFRPALAELAEGEMGFVGGHRVRRVDRGTFRLETLKRHVTGSAEEVHERIRRHWQDERPDRSRVAAALKRAGDYDEPHPFTEPKRHDADEAARKRVPAGARVVSLDPETRGRTGTLKRTDAGLVAHLDNSPDVKASDWEPLEAKHSWRAAEGKAAAKESPKQATLFALKADGGRLPKNGEGGHWITLGAKEGEDGPADGPGEEKLSRIVDRLTWVVLGLLEEGLDTEAAEDDLATGGDRAAGALAREVLELLESGGV